MGDLTLVVDSREQNGWDFPGVPTVRAGLDAGDYSLLGAETRFAIERKSIADLFGTVIRERDRFERELERLSRYEFAAILVEATVADILAFDSPESDGITEAQRKSRPATVLHSLLSWHVTYGVPTLFVGADRAVCARVVLRLAQKFAQAARAKTAGAA